MIIVTGASRGIGRTICENLMKNGISVLGISRIVGSVSFPLTACDVSSYEELKRVAHKLRNDGTEINGLINCAGVASMNLAITTPPEMTAKIINTNLLGTIYSCQNFAPLMIRQKSGTIINFSTIAVSLGLKGESIYAASKGGVEAFTRTFAREMSDFNIRVNCISPGPIATDLIRGLTDEQINNVISGQIIQKRFTPEDIAKIVELLLDTRSNSLTGQVFNIGGV
jgi:3-oxoacyl-[acyl-carrier protein] reductase